MNRILGRLLPLAAALALLAAPPANADKKYGLSSLTGEYHFTLVEIAVTSDVPPLTIYCNGYGRVVFDGAGGAELTSGYGLCSNGDEVVVPTTFTYTVAEDGEVMLTDEAGDETHCQVADRGTLLLCDGTGGPGGSPPSERVLWVVTAAKL